MYNQESITCHLCTTNLNMDMGNNNQCTNNNQYTNNNQVINNNKFIKSKSCTNLQLVEWTNLLNWLTQAQFLKIYLKIKNLKRMKLEKTKCHFYEKFLVLFQVNLSWL